MNIDRFSPSSSKARAKAQPEVPVRQQVGSQSANPSSKPGLPPSGPELKRTKSLPQPLPHKQPNRPEVKPVRKPITRAKPDVLPPDDFSEPPIKPRKSFGISFQTKKQKEELKLMNEQRIKEGAEIKADVLKYASDSRGYNVNVWQDSEYMDVVKAYHPKFDTYSPEKQIETTKQVLANNPRFLAGMAQARNEVSRIPNGPTATRTMRPDEQKFLTDAFKRIKEDIEKKPFHIHGESGIVANREGEITYFTHSPAGTVLTPPPQPGDKYHFHTHPPYGEPFASSASSTDHRLAARLYTELDNKMSAYVSNGKDVLHIQPDSMELVKLIPDPKVEKKLGEFPVAFTVPKPKDAPYPFANHEAPVAFKPWDKTK